MISLSGHFIRRRSAIWIAIGAIVLMLGSGCSKKSSPEVAAGTTTNSPVAVEPGLSVGTVRKGMTLEQVIQTVGAPDRRSASILEYPKLGFAVVADARGEVRSIWCGDSTGMPNSALVGAFTNRTKEGIGMGSTSEEIIKAYGDTQDTMPVPAGQQELPGRRTMVYKQLGLTFSLADDKVYHMIVDFRTPAN
jgi:hypothetical protein